MRGVDGDAWRVGNGFASEANGVGRSRFRGRSWDKISDRFREAPAILASMDVALAGALLLSRDGDRGDDAARASEKRSLLKPKLALADTVLLKLPASAVTPSNANAGPVIRDGTGDGAPGSLSCSPNLACCCARVRGFCIGDFRMTGDLVGLQHKKRQETPNLGNHQPSQ